MAKKSLTIQRCTACQNARHNGNSCGLPPPGCSATGTSLRQHPSKNIEHIICEDSIKFGTTLDGRGHLVRSAPSAADESEAKFWSAFVMRTQPPTLEITDGNIWCIIMKYLASKNVCAGCAKKQGTGQTRGLTSPHMHGHIRRKRSTGDYYLKKAACSRHSQVRQVTRCDLRCAPRHKKSIYCVKETNVAGPYQLREKALELVATSAACSERKSPDRGNWYASDKLHLLPCRPASNAKQELSQPMQAQLNVLIGGEHFVDLRKKSIYILLMNKNFNENGEVQLQVICPYNAAGSGSRQPLALVLEQLQSFDITTKFRSYTMRRFSKYNALSELSHDFKGALVQKLRHAKKIYSTYVNVSLTEVENDDAQPCHPAQKALPSVSAPPVSRGLDFNCKGSHEGNLLDKSNTRPAILSVSETSIVSSDSCLKEEGDEQQAWESVEVNPSVKPKLSDDSLEAVGKSYDSHVLPYHIRNIGLRGCKNDAGTSYSSAGHLTVYPVFKQAFKRTVGALERLAATPAGGNDSAAYSAELFRLISFLKWPQLGKMSALKFSSAGFHYTGPSDTVTCHSCSLSLRGWTTQAEPLDIHRQRCEGRCQLIGDTSPSSNIPLSATADPLPFVPDVSLHSTNSSTTTGRTTMTSVYSASATFSAVDHVTNRTTPQNATLKNISIPCSEEFSRCERGGIYRFLKDPIKALQSSESETFPAELRQQRPPDELWKFESQRLKSYDNKWQHDHIVKPRELARSGFYYTGPSNRVQCAFCQGALRNWEEGDNPEELHVKHFNYCRFVQGHDVGNVPIPFWPLTETTHTTAGDTSDAAGSVALGIFSSVPRHVDFAVESRRLLTFSTWAPPYPLRAEALAQAGFFYTGLEDAATCFYCNGTVSGWTADSDPWAEHARRYPTCPYLLQVKGRDIVEQQSNINEAALASNVQNTRFAVDPREVRARMDTPSVRVILKMDYPVDLVREVIQKRLSMTGKDHRTSEELLADVFAVHDEKQRSNHTALDTKAAPPMPVVVSQPSATGRAGSDYPSGLVASAASAPAFGDHRFASPTAPNSQPTSVMVAIAASAPAPGDPRLASAAAPDAAPTGVNAQKLPPDEENRQLRTQLTCKICMDAVVGIIFLPCGHLVSCAACAPALSNCPICRVNVRGTARVTF